MTVSDPTDASTSTDACSSLGVPNLRWWYRVVAVVAVCPIFASAISRGRSHWEPTWDVATTAVRIRDVFSAHPPLVGLAAWPSSEGSVTYSFPGAFHLYLLAVPVRLFGTTWGLLLGMAAINTAMCLVAIWLIRRRLGERWAIVGALFVALMLWTLGSGIMVYPTPLVVGAIPLFAFLVAAWSVADGDAPAVFVFAFVGNYLFLNQLVFIVVVPLVAVTALVWYVLHLRLVRRTDPAWWPVVKRRHLRWGRSATALTLVLWIPPMLDQFVTGGHNLGKLFHVFTSGNVAIKKPHIHHPSLGGALGMVTSVTTVPRGWLPPSVAKVGFDLDGGGSPFVVALVCTIVTFALVAWGVWRARRRGVRSVVTAASIACVGWVAYVITAANNPDKAGYERRYFLGLWPFAVFFWLVVIVGLFEGRRSPIAFVQRRPHLGIGATLVAVVGVTALSLFHPPVAPILPNSKFQPISITIRHTAAHANLGSGPLLVEADSDARRYLPSVLLGLQDAGIPFRVRAPFDIEQFGAARAYSSPRDATSLLFVSTVRQPNMDFVAALSPPPVLSARRFAELDAKMRRWARTTDRVRLNPALKVNAATSAHVQVFLDSVQRASRGTDGGIAASKQFLVAVELYGDVHGVPLVDIPGVNARDLNLWARQVLAKMEPTAFLYRAPPP